MKTLAKNRLDTGDKVRHKRYGPGVVLREWGSWFSCRHCYYELPLWMVTKRKRRMVDGELVETNAKPVKCPSCAKTSYPVQVNGEGVFDVRFPSGIHSINECWLIKEGSPKNNDRRFIQAD